MLICYEIIACNAYTSHCDTDANSKLDDGKAGADSCIIYFCAVDLSFYSIFPVFNII